MDELERELTKAPDGATARRYMAAARDAGRRDAAVLFLSDLYRRTKDEGLWEAVRDLFTAPELEGLGPPEAKTVGPEKEPLLAKRPYREICLSAFKAPFANASSIFMLVVSGPLLLGALMAMKVFHCVGLGLAIFLLGYLFGFLFDIVEQASQGHARGPRLLTLLWSDESRFVFVLHFLRWLGATAAAFWPIVALAGKLPAPILSVLSILLTVYYPVAILQAAYGHGFSAFNYPAAIARIRALGRDYWTCAGIFVATTLLVALVQVATYAWVGEVDERRLGGLTIVSTAAFVSWMIQMRAAGLLAWARGDVRQRM